MAECPLQGDCVDLVRRILERIHLLTSSPLFCLVPRELGHAVIQILQYLEDLQESINKEVVVVDVIDIDGESNEESNTESDLTGVSSYEADGNDINNIGEEVNAKTSNEIYNIEMKSTGAVTGIHYIEGEANELLSVKEHSIEPLHDVTNSQQQVKVDERNFKADTSMNIVASSAEIEKPNSDNILKTGKKFRNNQTREYKCTQCDIVFCGQQRLESHIINIHNSLCKVCSESFSSKIEMRVHLKQHRNCKLCGRNYRYASKLEKHMNSVHSMSALDNISEFYSNKKLLKCKQCLEEFSTKKILATHIFKAHFRIILCIICKEKFDSDDELKIHKKRHTTCDVCGVDQKWMNRLKRHKKTPNIHNKADSRAYTCDQCGKQCTLKRDVERHMESMHSGKVKRGTPCALCSFRCKVIDMEKHIAQKHKNVIMGARAT